MLALSDTHQGRVTRTCRTHHITSFFFYNIDFGVRNVVLKKKVDGLGLITKSVQLIFATILLFQIQR
jgi:hypothetical protein